MAKYLDQAGLQLVLTKITNKYDGRYLGINATAKAAEKVVHSLTIQVGDEEQRIFDGQADHSISVAAKVHGHQAAEVAYTNAAVSNAANVNEALDIIVKNIQIGAAAISSATSNMQALQDALDQEKADRENKDKELQDAIDILEGIIDDTIGNGSENLFEKIDKVKQELQQAIDTETQRASGIEAGLREDVDDHEARLEVIQGEAEVPGSIKAQVKVERDRAMEAEGVLRTAIETEKSQREQAVQDLADDLAEEITNRGTAEQALSDRITTNKNNIDILNGDGEGSVNKKVADAEARVEVVTNALAGRMTSAEGRLDVIQGTGEGSIKKAVADLVDGAPDTLDTLKELSAALKDNPNIITVLENEYKAAVNALEQKHDKEKKDLDDAIAKEIEDREAAVSAEKGLREEADEELSNRIKDIEDLVGDESLTLADIREQLQANANAIKTEKERAEGEEALIKDRLDVIEGTDDGSIKKAIADQAAIQASKDLAQDNRMQAIEDGIGVKGVDSTDSTGMYQFIFQQVEAEAQERLSADTTHDSRLTAIEELIGDGTGSATLAELNERLTEAEKDIDQCQKDIIANANAIAAIVALEESDIDAAFNAVFQ